MEKVAVALPTGIKEKLGTIQSTTIFGTVRQIAKDLGLNLDDAGLFKNYVLLDTVRRERQACAACPGRERCPLMIPGTTTKIEVTADGSLRAVLTACPKDKPYRYQKRIERLLASSRLPARFRTKTFATYQVTKRTEGAVALAKAIAEGQSDRGLLLAGPTGTGKTHLASAMVNARIDRGKPAIFCTVPDLLSDIRQAIRSEQETSELIELVKTAEFLVLDDFAAERTTSWVLEQLFILINAREGAAVQTVVTTNYSDAWELIERLKDPKTGDKLTGERIVSRLAGMCDWVQLDGEDWRLRRR